MHGTEGEQKGETAQTAKTHIRIARIAHCSRICARNGVRGGGRMEAVCILYMGEGEGREFAFALAFAYALALAFALALRA